MKSSHLYIRRRDNETEIDDGLLVIGCQTFGSAETRTLLKAAKPRLLLTMLRTLAWPPSRIRYDHARLGKN